MYLSILGALKRGDSGIFSVPLTRMSEQTIATQYEETDGRPPLTPAPTSLHHDKQNLVHKSSKDSGMLVH